MIYQNYPNPFNQGTIIEYELPSQLNAEISIYNVSGQRIYLRNLGLKPAGKYQFYWDGRDNLNNHLSSGVYYYRIKTEVGSKIKSLLLLK
jgi:flagellar hook assembly protein FlgD